MTYSYAQVQGGYRWNMLMRIKNTLGLWPTQTSDQGGQTLISFSRELTPAEKALLDTLMASNPTFPPTTGNTVFKIEDIYERLDKFNAANNENFQLYYSESVPGSGVIDTIELHATKVMTNNQKNQVKNVFSNIITVS